MSRERKRRLNLIDLAWVEGVVLRGTSWKFDPPKKFKKIESIVRGRGLWSLGEGDGQVNVLGDKMPELERHELRHEEFPSPSVEMKTVQVRAKSSCK